MINLNNELFNVDALPRGKNNNIEIKIGHKFYMVDIEKNVHTACVDFYPKMNKDCNGYSKYNAPNAILCVFVKPDAVLNRKFFEQISAIKEAQVQLRPFESVLV